MRMQKAFIDDDGNAKWLSANEHLDYRLLNPCEYNAVSTAADAKILHSIIHPEKYDFIAADKDM